MASGTVSMLIGTWMLATGPTSLATIWPFPCMCCLVGWFCSQHKGHSRRDWRPCNGSSHCSHVGMSGEHTEGVVSESMVRCEPLHHTCCRVDYRWARRFSMRGIVRLVIQLLLEKNTRRRRQRRQHAIEERQLVVLSGVCPNDLLDVDGSCWCMKWHRSRSCDRVLVPIVYSGVLL